LIETFFLGTGGGAPSKRRLPAYLFRRGAFNVLMDCGEGTQITMINHSLSIMAIKVVAITHMHADHVMGLPAMVQTMSMYNRSEKLYIIGPSKVQELLKATFELTHFYPTFRIEYVSEYEDKEVRLTPFPTKHVIPSQGYILEEKERINVDKERLEREGIRDWRVIRQLKEGKEVKLGDKVLKPEDYLIKKRGLKVAYTGDTSYSDRVVEAVKGADLLLHDSTFLDDVNAEEYGHSTVSVAAEVAKRAEVKRLALVHISGRYEDNEELERVARKTFKWSFAPKDLSYYVLRQG
jgi:ribonuclease Z